MVRYENAMAENGVLLLKREEDSSVCCTNKQLIPKWRRALVRERDCRS